MAMTWKRWVRASTPRTRLVYIANPNNPTGTWNETGDIVRFLERVPPTTLVVLDEAYFEYARSYGCPDGIGLVERFPNLVVLRTFSKAHALAGVRVGYAVSHPQVADMLNRVRAAVQRRDPRPGWRCRFAWRPGAG